MSRPLLEQQKAWEAAKPLREFREQVLRAGGPDVARDYRDHLMVKQMVDLGLKASDMKHVRSGAITPPPPKELRRNKDENVALVIDRHTGKPTELRCSTPALARSKESGSVFRQLVATRLARENNDANGYRRGSAKSSTGRGPKR